MRSSGFIMPLCRPYPRARRRVGDNNPTTSIRQASSCASIVRRMAISRVQRGGNAVMPATMQPTTSIHTSSKSFVRQSSPGQLLRPHPREIGPRLVEPSCLDERAVGRARKCSILPPGKRLDRTICRPTDGQSHRPLQAAQVLRGWCKDAALAHSHQRSCPWLRSFLDPQSVPVP